jgi:hypothetical protein
MGERVRRASTEAQRETIGMPRSTAAPAPSIDRTQARGGARSNEEPLETTRDRLERRFLDGTTNRSSSPATGWTTRDRLLDRFQGGSAGTPGPRGERARLLQRLAGARPAGDKEPCERAHDVAERGFSSGGGPLPHAAAIQRAFGPRHDVSRVVAHVGGSAADASDALGAEAYTSGDRVAFARPPSLHTAAHEAAHVVQQRGGIHLKGGVGEVGDPFELEADAVADRVVRGQPAGPLLDRMAPGSSTDMTADEASARRAGAPRGSGADSIGAAELSRAAFSGVSRAVGIQMKSDDDRLRDAAAPRAAAVKKPSPPGAPQASAGTATAGAGAAPLAAPHASPMAGGPRPAAPPSGPPSTVPAIPMNWKVKPPGDTLDSPNLGLKVNESWLSSSGKLSDLAGIWISEAIQMTSATGTLADIEGDYGSPVGADGGEDTDTHDVPPSGIDRRKLPSKSVTEQAHYYFTGGPGMRAAVPKSGYRITREIKEAPPKPGSTTPGWVLTVTKEGASVSVDGLKTDAGDGWASSDPQPV